MSNKSKYVDGSIMGDDLLFFIEQGKLLFTAVSVTLATLLSTNVTIKNNFQAKNNEQNPLDMLVALDVSTSLPADITVYENVEYTQSTGTLLIPKTYNRVLSDKDNPDEAEIINSPTITNDGDVLIPTFAVGTPGSRPSDVGIGDIASSDHPIILGPGQSLNLDVFNTDAEDNTISIGIDFALTERLF